jgi:hypothetical protein
LALGLRAAKRSHSAKRAINNIFIFRNIVQIFY